MTRWLVQFGYDGSPFAGWARQPGRRTVEGELREGIVRCGIAASDAAAQLAVASRTDLGVSARANALAVSSAMEGAALLRAMNGIAPEILAHRARPVDAAFRIRTPRAREYRYFLPSSTAGLDRWRELLPAFLDGPIDARSFARGVPRELPCWRNLEELELLREPGGYALRVRAGGFLWGMVRKIVAALMALGDGRLSGPQLDDALRGRRRLAVPLADPEPLVLWEVDFGSDWPYRQVPLTRGQSAHLATERRRAEARARILAELARR
jgi:tRNA pseudouridine38-40 synthase